VQPIALHSAPLAHPSQLPGRCTPSISKEKKRKQRKAENAISTVPPPHIRIRVLRPPHPVPAPPACMSTYLGRYLPTLPPSPIGADPIARPGSPTRIATSRHNMTSPGRQFRSGPPGTARRVEARRLFGSEIGRCLGRGRHGLVTVLCYAMLCHAVKDAGFPCC
jgi:hypothetical protein